MNAQQLWQTFLETGSPEVYLLYNHAKKVDGLNVFDSTGFGTSSNGI